MENNNKEKIENLLASLNGARQLTPLELNEIRFAGKKTVITPGKLGKNKATKSK